APRRLTELAVRGSAARFPDQTCPGPPPPSLAPTRLAHPPAAASHVPAGGNNSPPPLRSAATALLPPSKTSSATVHAAPQFDPAPPSAPFYPPSHKAAPRPECDRPRSLPPSAPKTTTAAAHKTEEAVLPDPL